MFVCLGSRAEGKIVETDSIGAPRRMKGNPSSFPYGKAEGSGDHELAALTSKGECLLVSSWTFLHRK